MSPRKSSRYELPLSSQHLKEALTQYLRSLALINDDEIVTYVDSNDATPMKSEEDYFVLINKEEH